MISHYPHKSEEIIVKKIKNFSRKVKETRNISLLSTNNKSINTIESLSTRRKYNLTSSNNKVIDNKIINSKIDKFMNKTLNIIKKKEEKEIPIFFFLKSTNHTEIKPRKKIYTIENIKTRFKESKLEPLNLIKKRIEKEMDKSILKHHLTEIELEKKNCYSDRNNNDETIEEILNKDKFKYNKQNFHLVKIPPHLSKRTPISSFSNFGTYPSIMKDNGLMVRMFKKNFNYMKNNIKDKFKGNEKLIEYI